MTAWNVPEVRRLIRAIAAEGYELAGIEQTPAGFKLLTRPRGAVVSGTNPPEAEDEPEDEVARKRAVLAARRAAGNA